MTYLVLGTSSIGFFSDFGAWFFLPSLHKGGVPTVARALIPKSIPTKLSILGNTSGKAKLLLQNLENIH